MSGTTRPRMYLLVDEIPEQPELTNATLFTSKDDLNDWIEKCGSDPDHTQHVFELDSLYMCNYWVQTFNERDDQ